MKMGGAQMNELVPVSKIDFGAIDGKIEARDPNFESMFYDNDNYYSQLANDQTTYIIYGRKGTGKTLLLQYFLKKQSKENDTFTKLIPPEDFIEVKLNYLNHGKLSDEETKIFWKFFILMKLSSIVLEHEKGILNAKKLSHLREVDVELQFQLKSFIEESTSQVRSQLSLNPNLSAGLSDTVKSVYQPSKYFEVLKSLENKLFDVLKKSSKTYYIAFDDLDDLNMKGESDPSHEDNLKALAKLMISLVKALEHINDNLYEIGSKSRILTTLRQDVVDEMQNLDGNINKPLSGRSIGLSWMSPVLTKNPQKSSLGKLVLHKIKGSVTAYKQFDDTKLFKMIFPSNKHGRPFDFIVKRSFGRPRDIIQFLTTFQSTFGNEHCIRTSELSQVQGKYSTWFYNELKNEVNILENATSINDTLLLIKKYKHTGFMIADLEKFLKTNSDEFKKINDLREDIKSLYKLGVLSNNDKQGSDYKEQSNFTVEYAYRDGLTSANFDNFFKIHIAIRDYLSI